MGHISVIGSCNMDLTIEASRRPAAGETIIGKRLFVSPGGKGANQAVAASRLGGKVYMIGCVGQDLYGRELINALHKSGVNTDYVKAVSDTSTGVAQITLAEGDNSIIVIHGANAEVGIDEIDKAWPVISSSSIVMLQHEIPEETNEYIIHKCYKAGIEVLLNPAPYHAVSEEIIHEVAYFTPNEHEAASLFKSHDMDAILKKYPNKLIMTVGSNGVEFNNGGAVVHVPSYKVPVVDTTGAGDTFNGAFAVARAEGKDLAESIAFANGAAALSIGKIGAQSGMPWRKELEAFLSCRK